MNEAFFQFFRVYPPLRAIKAYMSLTPPGGESQNWYWLHPAARAASALQYSFDVRSFNINCGFSADGNVFFIAVTL